MEEHDQEKNKNSSETTSPSIIIVIFIVWFVVAVLMYFGMGPADGKSTVLGFIALFLRELIALGLIVALAVLAAFQRLKKSKTNKDA